MHIIGNNLFFDLQIGELTNFINENDLILFRLIETAGSILPVFSIVFRTMNSDVRNKVLENNPLVVKMGEDESNMECFNVSIVDKKIQNSANNDSYIIDIRGVLNSKKYILDKLIRSERGTSLDVIKIISNEFFQNFESDISNVNEQPMDWKICNETNSDLMTDAWLHMDIDPSSPLLAITRKGTVLLKDMNKIKNSAPIYNFVQKSSPENSNEIVFINNFEPKNYAHVYNLHAGYGKVVNIFEQDSGNTTAYVNENEPNISATQEVEISEAGNKVIEGYLNTDNVHSTYWNSYFYNTSKLLQLSNIIGCVEFRGFYKKDLNLLDYVNVQLSDPDKYNTLTGRYIVDTIEYSFSSLSMFTTKVYVARDNFNNIENNIAKADNRIKIPASIKSSILTNMRNTRRLLAMSKSAIGSEVYDKMLSYLTDYKYKVLNSFSANNVKKNLSTQGNISNDLLISGDNIIKNVLGKIIPEATEIVNTLSYGANLDRNILSNTLKQYAEPDMVNILEDLVFTFSDMNTNLDTVISMVKQTEIAENAQNINLNNVLLNNFNNTSIGGKVLNQDNATPSTRVNNIVNLLLENIRGLDIPIPIIELTESQKLYDDIKLKDYIVNVIINHITSLGYLNNVNNFKSILLGLSRLDYNTINTINLNIGITLYTRHWGSFKEVTDLTDDYVRKSYKDKFKTLDCIKTVDARGGKKVFFALPMFNKEPKFYINSKLTKMNNTDISLRYFDDFGNEIKYLIYYSDEGFNSNSVLLEVRAN